MSESDRPTWWQWIILITLGMFLLFAMWAVRGMEGVATLDGLP